LGDPKKKKKRYITPKRPYDVNSLEEELRLVGAYGLRNKRELWRHRTEISILRRRGREMLSMDPIERVDREKELIRKLIDLGLVGENATLEDVLSLNINDIMERRLQTVIFRRGMAKSLYQARQLITHGHIAINSRKVKAPSYKVTAQDETKLDFAESSPLAGKSHVLRQELSIEEMRGEGPIE
jgi:small subunit ribosomal protein S4